MKLPSLRLPSNSADPQPEPVLAVNAETSQVTPLPSSAPSATTTSEKHAYGLTIAIPSSHVLNIPEVQSPSQQSQLSDQATLHDDSSTSAPINSIVAQLELSLYQAADSDDLMPVGLEGLISNQVYASRLQKLNEGFKTLSVPMDLGPMIRLASLIVLLGASAGLMTIADDITVQVFVCIAALSFQVAVNILTFRPKKFEVFINDQLKVFNQEDETIKLIWKLNSTVNEMRNVFYFKPIPYARSVLVRHTNKGGVEEFLPAYTERFDLMNWFVAAGSTAEGTGGAASPAVVPRVPSYRSMA